MIKVNNFECKTIHHHVPGVPIVFLHGYSLTSEIWNKISVLSLLEDQKIPFLALDMPYAPKSKCSPKTLHPDDNVNFVWNALYLSFGLSKCVIVGGSLGGYMALRYALKNTTRGVMLMAPVWTTEEGLTEQYSHLKIPVSIILGSNDPIVSLDEMDRLTRLLPNARLSIYENAGHGAYLDNPERFKKELLSVYNDVT